MRLINVNLTDPEYGVFNQFFTVYPISQVKDADFGDIVLLKIPDLSQQSRWVLRKAINQYPNARIVVLSLNGQVARFAWRINAFHFIGFPLSFAKIQPLRIKIKHRAEQSFAPKLKLAKTGGYDYLPLREIAFILGKGDYIDVYLLNKTKPDTYTNRLGAVSNNLLGYPNFKKINRSTLINLNHVRQIKKNLAFFNSDPKLALKLSPDSRKELIQLLLWVE